MPDFAWGLQIMVVGMGVVFGLLLALMLLLYAMERLDRRRAISAQDVPLDSPTPTAPNVAIHADGLSEQQLAAIAIAVITHARIHRRSAAPETRVHPPGRQLHASRWVGVGRGRQLAPFVRRG